MKLTKTQLSNIIKEEIGFVTESSDRSVSLSSEELWFTLLAVEKYRALARMNTEEGDIIASAFRKLKAAY
jgi:hypothetical protein